MRNLFFSIFFALALLAPRGHAQDAAPPRLSDRGRTLIAGGISGYWATDKNLVRQAATEWAVDVAPSVAYFFWQRVALGAYGGYGRTQERLFSPPVVFGLGPQGWFPSDPTAEQLRTAAIRKIDRFTAGLQGIAELALAPRLGLFVWMTTGYAYERSRLEMPEGSPWSSNIQGGAARLSPPMVWGDNRSAHAMDASLFVPLTFHVSGSVALGMGPYVSWRGYFKGENGHSVRIGASSWIGASF